MVAGAFLRLLIYLYYFKNSAAVIPSASHISKNLVIVISCPDSYCAMTCCVVPTFSASADCDRLDAVLNSLIFFDTKSLFMIYQLSFISLLYMICNVMSSNTLLRGWLFSCPENNRFTTLLFKQHFKNNSLNPQTPYFTAFL